MISYRVLAIALAAALSAQAQQPAGDFSQAPLISTGITTDLAIDGVGLFILEHTNDEYRYTRFGRFGFSCFGVLSDRDDRPVIGFGITPSGIPNGAFQRIDVSRAVSFPQATDSIDLNINLDPGALWIPVPFDPLDPINTASFQVGIRVFDSLPADCAVTWERRRATACRATP